jgi:phage terminase large subunit
MASAHQQRERRRRIQFPKYAKRIFRKFRYKVLYGGRGGARSWTFARAALLRCAKEETRVLCTREYQSSLKDSVHQLLRDQIKFMDLPGFIVTNREIRHVNGSLILFHGLHHNITKIKSLEAIDICWVEEAERVSKESWRTLIPTIRKPGSEIWVSFNPDEENDATWQRFIVNRPKDSWVLKVNADDNPWFPAELKEERAYDYKIDPEAAGHVWGGELRTISDAQIIRGKWKSETFEVPHIVNVDDEKEYLWDGPYQGLDFGFGSDPTAGVRCWIEAHEDGPILRVEAESYHHKLDIDDTPDTVARDIPGFELSTIRADSARPDSISYCRRHGLGRIKGAKKGPGSVEDGIAYLRSFQWIVFHPSCVHGIAEAKFYKYKVDERSGDVLTTIVDKHNHIIDALRYALEPMVKKSRLSGVLWAGDVEDPEEAKLCPECHGMELNADNECENCGYVKPGPPVFPRAPKTNGKNGKHGTHANGNGKTTTNRVAALLGAD